MSFISDDTGEDAVLGLPETGLAIIPGYVTNLVLFLLLIVQNFILFDGNAHTRVSLTIGRTLL